MFTRVDFFEHGDIRNIGDKCPNGDNGDIGDIGDIGDKCCSTRAPCLGDRYAHCRGKISMNQIPNPKTKRRKESMSQLNLTPDELLTTRSVRKRLDFSRPVEPALIRECLELAVQAPTGGNRQTWHFVVVTDAQQRQALGDIYRRGFASYLQQTLSDSTSVIRSLTREQRVTLKKVRDSSSPTRKSPRQRSSR